MAPRPQRGKPESRSKQIQGRAIVLSGTVMEARARLRPEQKSLPFSSTSARDTAGGRKIRKIRSLDLPISHLGLPFSGDVVLSDSMFMGGGLALPAPIAIAPPFGCAPPPPCRSRARRRSIARGRLARLLDHGNVPAGPLPGYWRRTTASPSAPGVPPPALPRPPRRQQHGAQVPVDPLPLNNCREEALHAGKCFKAPGNTILCDYEISVTNDGLAVLGMPVARRKGACAATLTVTDANWNCAGGPPTTRVQHAGPIDIAVAASLKLPLQVSIPLAPLGSCPAARCPTRRQSRRLQAAARRTSTLLPATATPRRPMRSLAGSIYSACCKVTCDPTNLKTTKISKGDCVVSGAGYRCDYTVAVANTGPDPITARKVNEELGFARRRRCRSRLHGAAPAAGRASSAPIRTSTWRRGRQRRAQGQRRCAGQRTMRPDRRATTVFPVPGHALQQRAR